jgi:hypothetical protein
VQDCALLPELAAGAWTRENIVVDAGIRNSSARVFAVLGTSKAMQGYTVIQDVIARGMVEALEATVTDGASLTKAIPTLTGKVVMTQLKTAPKTIFILAAQHGMNDSITAYKQMEGMLPPGDASVLNVPDLNKIRGYYFQGRTLELPYMALAAKLMPVSGTDLRDQAFASVISELIPSVGFSATDVVTLNNLLTLQSSVANLKAAYPALQTFSQNLTLAHNLFDANMHTIASWSQPDGLCRTQAAARN